MSKIFSALRRALSGIGRGTARDPLAAMSVRELADLPAYHPQSER
jgi:hypothetical protein